ncbi:MAG: polysaccharide deacetylase family protein [Elusimicrobiota bacterium]|jgi:peptidoglycan/xylan/chitin deacetylase (PgdA/CDA1 family)|nr:polysaccharide deacetylase family protein [Elusimicrobiota bacterium]
MSLILTLLPPRKGLAVLMYHHFGPVTCRQEAGFFIPDEMFERQLDYILNKGYKTLSFSEVETASAQKRPLPAKAVLITLDDGWKDNYTNAYPIIKKKNVKINIFLNTGDISRDARYLTWDEVKEMRSCGLVQFAPHGVSHKRLRSLTDAQIKDEVSKSKQKLQEQLGVEVKSFCYPYGAADKRVRQIVFDAGYSLDFGTRKGVCPWPWDGKKPIKRAHIMACDDLKDFHLNLTRGRCRL